MSKSKLMFIVSGCLVILFCFAPAIICGESSDEVFRRFKKESFSIWKDHFKNTTCSSGCLTSKIQTEMPSENGDTAEIEVNSVMWKYLSPYCFSTLVLCNDPDLSLQQEGDGEIGVYCFNPKYTFEMERNFPEDDWSIASLTPVSRKERFSDLWDVLITSSQTDDSVRKYRLLVKTCFSEYMMPDDSFFPALFHSSLISIDKYELTEENELKIFFSVQSGGDQGTIGPFHFESGEVILNSETWLIQSLRLVYGNWEQQMSCQYDGIGETSQQLTSKIVKTIYGDGRVSEVTDIFSYSSESLVPSFFTLTNYGFHEPEFHTSKPNRIRYLMMGLGSLMILLALYQIYQKRKNREESA